MNLELSLNVAPYDLKFKGQVRNSVDLALGIEFREARKGDMQMLQHLVRKLDEQKLEECFQFDATS
jgi:hypothetical protein